MPTFAARHHALHAGPAAARAANAYRTADLNQRIAAATPHELVAMLFDGARAALVAAERAVTVDDVAVRVKMVTRALAILDALDAALDHGRGGGVARALAASYAQVRALAVAGNSERRGELFAAAARQIGDLGACWGAIAPGERMPAA